MKTILAPTDFSKNAFNAIQYAVEIAKLTKSKLVLFNVYQIPLVVSEAPVVIPMEEIEKDSMENLKEIEKNIYLKHGDKINIECQCRCGSPIDEINIFEEENKIDLIVMGMEGAGYLSEKLIGSITTSLIAKAKCPVLAIDKNVIFKNINKIAFACDHEEIQSKSILDELKEFAQLFKSHVYVLNIVPESETLLTIRRTTADTKINQLLEGIDHSFHSAKNKNVVAGINDFVNEEKIDMVVMIPRVHSAFYNLFSETNTKQMAFHTQVPLLALHGIL